MSVPDRAVSGPRALKEAGSADWCWQTVDLLKRYLYNIEQTWRQADEVVEELQNVKAWKVIPPDKPYGTFNKLCEELLGMPARDVAGKIDREKIKALGPHGGNRRGRDFQAGGTHLFAHNTALDFIARLKRDDEVLAQKVIRGEITPNAAAREKGWRKPRIVVSSPERIAESLRKYMNADDIAKLIALLAGLTLSADDGRDE